MSKIIRYATTAILFMGLTACTSEREVDSDPVTKKPGVVDPRNGADVDEKNPRVLAPDAEEPQKKTIDADKEIND